MERSDRFQESSKFSANHIRLLHPDVQDMVYRSLVQSFKTGSADAALYLSIFHTNIQFDSLKACEYILRAAELGSSSAMYLCYRIHKAHGIPLPISQLDLGGWFHTGICWGSQIAYQDAVDSGQSISNTAVLILKQQGSCYGDTPFREAVLAGPFDLLRDDFTRTMEKVRSLNQDIDDIIIAGDNGDKILHWAAAMHGSPFQRDKGLLTALLTESKASVNVLNAKGETPLLVAMRAGNGPAVAELMKFGADPSIRSKSGQVPLHWLWTLVEYSSQPSADNEYAMRILCQGLCAGSRSVLHSVADTVSGRVNGFKDTKHSARLQSYILSDLPAGTPLHWAIQRRCIPVILGLLAAGAMPSVCAHGADTSGGPGHGYALSSFHLAAAMHDDDILKLLLEAEPNGLENLRPCPLAVAIDGNVSQGYANGRFERMARHGPHYRARAQRTFQLFWDHKYRELGYGFKSGPKGATPLIIAVQSGQTDVVEALLNTPFKKDLETRGNEGENTPLQESIKRRCDDVYFLLRRRRANVSSTWGLNNGGFTNLALLATVGHNRLEVAKDLIGAGIPVRSRNPSDLSPFAMAVSGAFFPLARFLLDHGASPNELQSSGVGFLALRTLGPPTTVLGCLVHQCTGSQLLSLTWLLDEHIAGRLGARLDPMACATMGANVYHILAMAVEEGRDDDAVVSAFRKLRAAFPEPSLLRDIMQLSESKTLGDMRVTPLLMAVEMSNPRLVREMLDAGADPLHEVTSGATIADYAQHWAKEFAQKARNGTLRGDMMPSDASEIPRMLARRERIAALLNPKNTEMGALRALGSMSIR
jgi:ankyrin repeat protein